MSEVETLKPEDFASGLYHSLEARARTSKPSSLAAQGAWRQRTWLAVIAGVFLASLVITTVLATAWGVATLL